MFDIYAFSLQENYAQIFIAIFLLFAILQIWLVHDLIQNMRTMVRLKYHSLNRAEFDEGRVKIILGINFVVWILFLAGFLYGLLYLDQEKPNDLDVSSKIISLTTSCVLICTYALYYLNNRVKSDIKKIKKINPDSKEDLSQNITNHL